MFAVVVAWRLAVLAGDSSEACARNRKFTEMLFSSMVLAVPWTLESLSGLGTAASLRRLRISARRAAGSLLPFD